MGSNPHLTEAVISLAFLKSNFHNFIGGHRLVKPLGIEVRNDGFFEFDIKVIELLLISPSFVI